LQSYNGSARWDANGWAMRTAKYAGRLSRVPKSSVDKGRKFIRRPVGE